MTRSLFLISSIVAILTPQQTFAWPRFMSEVPNGKNATAIKMDLGHAEGNLLRNPFGLAWDVNRNWTKEFCQADADGDGQTNGQELGDPCCVWSIGHDERLQRLTGLSNPGNKSSVSDANLWKNVDCAAAAKQQTSSASHIIATATTGVVLSTIMLIIG